MQGKRLKVANGGEILVDEGVNFEDLGVLVWLENRPVVITWEGKAVTVLSLLKKPGWLPKNGDWRDLRSENLTRPRRGKQGKGYYFHTQRGRWHAQVNRKSLGLYDTEEEAKLAVEEYKRNNITS